jgi:hypothetical protein
MAQFWMAYLLTVITAVETLHKSELLASAGTIVGCMEYVHSLVSNAIESLSKLGQ